MMSFALFKVYLSANLGLGIISLGLAIYLNRHFPFRISYRQLLRLIRLSILTACLAPIFLEMFAKQKSFQPSAQLWSAASRRHFLNDDAFSPKTFPAVSIGEVKASLDLHDLTVYASFLFLSIVVIAIWRIRNERQKIEALLATCVHYKGVGKTRILLSSIDFLPFALWQRRLNLVVLPQSLLLNFESFKIILKHELQHHRQGDSRWIYVLEFVGVLCFWNPLVKLLKKQVMALHELACDEALVGQRGISSLTYCECLLWAAQNFCQGRQNGFGTAAFAQQMANSLLSRRIESMLGTTKIKLPRAAALVAGMLSLGFLTMAMATTQSEFQDRRIGLQDAQAMAARAGSSEIPLGVNDLVLAQLNRYLATPDGRAFFKGSMVRMRTYETQILTALGKSQMPLELLAVPLVESGYQNLPPRRERGIGAGLWMFIKKTARDYGLRVDDEVDERLNASLATQAAIKYLSVLHWRFQDWRLALLAFNAGEGRVQAGIRETGSRDVWTLIRKGYGNDPGYVASVIAAILIMKNPESLN